jgi:hypothetical protein
MAHGTQAAHSHMHDYAGHVEAVGTAPALDPVLLAQKR